MSIKKYSSGQWVDIPYRKYGTETDTITSFPKEIITDGQPIGANLFNNKGEVLTGNGSVINVTETGIKTIVQSQGSNRYSSLKLDNELLGKTITISANITQSASNKGQIRLYYSNGRYATSLITSITTAGQTGYITSTYTMPSSIPSGSDGIAIVLSSDKEGDGEVGDYVIYADLMIAEGNQARPYQPYAPTIIKGNMVQTGTPSPSSIIMPSECGERTENWFNQNDYELVQITASSYRYGTIVGILPAGTYTFNAVKNTTTVIYLTKELNGVYTYETISSLPFNFTADGVTKYIIRTAGVSGTTWADFGYTDMIINTGSTALPYEPYGYKIPILSGGVTTPVYLGEVQSTRQIYKMVFDGTESGWRTASGFFFNQELSPDYLRAQGQNTLICSHYQSIDQVGSGSAVGNNQCSLYYAQGVQRLYFQDSRFSTLEDFTTYLQQQYSAGTPVCVWYVLATPTKGIVNEPIRKIGEYADSVSVSNIPTTGTAESFDISTTLKPSEVQLTYHGWHEHSDTKFTE